MKAVSLVLAALSAVVALEARAVTLDFDGPVDLDISTDFAGFTFIAPGVGSPVRTWTAYSDTAPNVLGLSLAGGYALNQVESTAIDVVFDTPVSFVSVRAAFVTSSELYTPFTGSLPFMAVYNSSVISAGNRIGLVTWNNPADACFNSNTLCSSSFQTLEFSSASQNIKAIRLTGFAPPAGYPTRRAIFDTLVTSNQVAQSITFPQPGTVPTGWSFFHFATATSGLPVSVTSNTPGICSVSGDTIYLGTSAGTCSLTANQAGNGSYLPAAPVTVTFGVFDKNDVVAAQGAMLGTDGSWRVTPIDPGSGSGWNTNVGFDDSGWQLATVIGDLWQILGRPFFCLSIWSSGGQFSTTETTIWGRRVLNLTQVPAQAWMEGGVDDDIQIYINGTNVVNDANGVANNFSRDIAPYLVAGDNLFAFVASDNYAVYGYNHQAVFQMRSSDGGPIGSPVPVPPWAFAPLGAALVAAGVFFIRADRRPARRTR